MQISPFVHSKKFRERGSDYKKIELFWPHSLLKVSDRLLRVQCIIIIFILRTTFGVELRKRQSVLDEEVAKMLYQQVDNYIFDVINILRLKLLTIQDFHNSRLNNNCTTKAKDYLPHILMTEVLGNSC